MTTTPHILAGAALASLLPTHSVSMKVLGFTVGFASHYILDAVPHWERLYGALYNDELPTDYSQWPKNVTVQGLVDVLIGSALFLVILFTVIPGPSKICVLLGGLGAVLPDLMDNLPWWSERTKQLPIWRYFRKLHDWSHMSYDLQRKLPSSIGLFTQIAVIVVALLVLI
jgi:hypothetical protein